MHNLLCIVLPLDYINNVHNCIALVFHLREKRWLSLDENSPPSLGGLLPKYDCKYSHYFTMVLILFAFSHLLAPSYTILLYIFVVVVALW